MHGHGGLPGACHPLDDDIVVGGLADDFVLLLLDRGDDFAQHGLLVLGQVLGQQLVIGDDLAVKIVQQPAFVDFIGALQVQTDGYLPVSRRRVAALPQAVLVVGVGHRGAPVHHDLMGRVTGDAASADVNGLVPAQRLVVEVYPAEIRLAQGFLVPLIDHAHLVVQGHGVLQQVDQFRVVVVEVVQHHIDFRPQAVHLLAIVGQIVTDDGERLLQECLLVLPGGAP